MDTKSNIIKPTGKEKRGKHAPAKLYSKDEINESCNIYWCRDIV